MKKIIISWLFLYFKKMVIFGHFWCQWIAKSDVSIHRWNQRWISFILSPNNRNYGDHWKNVITGTLKLNKKLEPNAVGFFIAKEYIYFFLNKNGHLGSLTKSPIKCIGLLKTKKFYLREFLNYLSYWFQIKNSLFFSKFSI